MKTTQEKRRFKKPTKQIFISLRSYKLVWNYAIQEKKNDDPF